MLSVRDLQTSMPAAAIRERYNDEIVSMRVLATRATTATARETTTTARATQTTAIRAVKQ
jgi:hypothetical protein